MADQTAITGLVDEITAAVEARLRANPAFVASIRDTLTDTHRIPTAREQRIPTAEPRWYRRNDMLLELDRIGMSTQDRYRQRGLVDQKVVGRYNLYDRSSIIGLSELIRAGVLRLLGQTDAEPARARPTTTRAQGEALPIHLGSFRRTGRAARQRECQSGAAIGDEEI